MNNNKYLVKKASGEVEPFSQQKLENSLRKAGASEETIENIVADIKNWLQEGVSTRQIYARAFGLLKKKTGSTAARYKLKKAMMELGPTGFPFEHFIGEIMKLQGFEVQTGQIIQGNCVQHEVDVVATNQKIQRLVECKYHNSPDKISNVQVPLYIRSRMNDIIDRRKKNPEFAGLEFEGWVVTNTRFSSDAIAYGTCSGLKMLSWDFPENHALKDLVEHYHLFPITTLAHLNQKQKVLLTEKGIVLCRQLLQEKQLLDELNLSHSAKRKILNELESL
ncbi:MAG TPA: ATP cone domain-containing protein [Draconibacterium sp.]|nr:ATP cone domain-containing protein [Draconibacterium sp.]